MHKIREEIRTVHKQGKAALLFIIYSGHGTISLDGETFAVMPSGNSFVNLTNFAYSCALKN